MFNDSWLQQSDSLILLLHDCIGPNESKKAKTTKSVVFALNCFEYGLRRKCEKRGLYFNEYGNTYSRCVDDNEFEFIFKQAVPYKIITPNYSILATGKLYLYHNLQIKFINNSIPRLYIVCKCEEYTIPLDDTLKTLALQGSNGLKRALAAHREIVNQPNYLLQLKSRLLAQNRS